MWSIRSHALPAFLDTLARQDATWLNSLQSISRTLDSRMTPQPHTIPVVLAIPCNTYLWSEYLYTEATLAPAFPMNNSGSRPLLSLSNPLLSSLHLTFSSPHFYLLSSLHLTPTPFFHFYHSLPHTSIIFHPHSHIPSSPYTYISNPHQHPHPSPCPNTHIINHTP